MTDSIIFDFEATGSTESWRPIDDRVMGGVSSSQMVWENSKAIFSGTVSPDNNGGFCSVRSLLSEPLSENVNHIWIESSGEPNIYALTIRTNRTFDGINYQADFTSSKQLTRINIPLIEFKAQYRGRYILDAPELVASDIQQFGIMISDRQYGAFELSIKSIGASVM